MPEEKRAIYYLALLDFITACKKDPNHPKPNLEGFSKAIEGIDISAIQEQLKSGEPVMFNRPIFGSKNFIKEILESEGWLPGSVHAEKEESARSGQGK